MTALGAFRDDFYNASAVLPQSQVTTVTANEAGTVLSATVLAGAQDVYLVASGQTAAQGVTTDSAVNIVSQLQQAVAVAYKAALSSFGAGVNPPPGVPNLFNMTYTLTIANGNTSAGAITLTGGTGVTIAGSAVAAIATNAIFVVSVTSPTTITITRASV